MKKFAVIDIGSNSVRLMFVADGKVLYKRLQTTRLGEGLAFSGELGQDPISRSVAAVACFHGQAVAEGAERVLVFATAAVRSAKNGNVFVQAVKAACGLDVQVISGETEAEIGILGALGNKDGGVIDVGGASTEIVIKTQGKMTYKKSVDVGVVRLKDTCGRDRERLFAHCEEKAELFSDLPKVKSLCAIGGTATTLAALVLGLKEYDPQVITGSKITAKQMKETAEMLLTKSVEEIAAMPCMPKGRADVLTGGAVWLATLMEKKGMDELIVSDRDNLEGFAVKNGLME
ncbi:MAG: hypothetical protein J6A63_00410 [Clostridia bacterium]|nr:hypothetical protein [Clostridia bacterium]